MLALSVSDGHVPDVRAIERDTVDLQLAFGRLGLDVKEVRDGSMPDGARGDDLAVLGALILQLLPTALQLIPPIIDILRDWARTPHGDRSIHVKHRRPDGTYSEVKIGGGSDEQVNRVLSIYQRQIENDLGAGSGA